ncbi:MAG TPA: hypothetical protein VGL15_07575, partial [Vicinamibacteria bacterium]
PANVPGVEGASVLQHHKHASRDGLYVEPAFTKAAAAGLHRDLTFNATIQGPTYAQPLYLEGGPGGRDVVIAATEQNRVYALDAGTGAAVWERQLGSPAPTAGSGICGNVNPLGITGTPAIDAASRTVYLDAMTIPPGASSRKHLIFALSLDDGSTRPGWPVDVSALQSGGTAFNAPFENQRGALLLVNGTLYVPYGGHFGDCGDYHGWVVGVPVDNPGAARAFATAARGGGIWAPGGLASDGVSVFASTGNTFGTSTWGHGEAVLRLRAGPAFDGATTDYFAPSNWQALDNGDIDVGGSGPILIDVPGATPSQLVVALGKNGVAYLLDRSNLGGIGRGNGTAGEGVASARVASSAIINAAAAYTTSQGTYVALRGSGVGCPGGAGDLVALKIGAAAPPQISVAWCARQNGSGSPMVTTTDGRSEAIVWGLGAESGNRLMGFDGDTGQVVFGGGGASEAMSNIRRLSTPIAAKGRIFVASDTAVYAFTTQ